MLIRYYVESCIGISQLAWICFMMTIEIRREKQTPKCNLVGLAKTTKVSENSIHEVDSSARRADYERVFGGCFGYKSSLGIFCIVPFHVGYLQE